MGRTGRVGREGKREKVGKEGGQRISFISGIGVHMMVMHF